MSTVVHFEVYVYDDIRGWALQTRYPGDERLKAIEEAKMLEFTLSKPVRVVRETYFPASNASEEVVTYIGRIKPKPRAQTPRRAGGGGIEARGVGGAPFSERDIANAYGGGAGRAKATADFAFRLIVVMIASLTVAVVGTGVLSMLGGRLLAQLGLAGATQSLLMFVIFMGLFLLTAVPLVMLYVPLDDLFRPPARPQPPAARQKDPIPSPAPKVNDTPEKQVEAAVAAQIEDDAGPTVPPAEDTAAAKAEAERARREAEEAAEAARREAAEAAQAEAASKEAGDADEATESSLALEQCRLIMMKFLGGAVSAIKTVRPQLDAYNRFGINLYLAGACGALAEARQLSDTERRVLIQEAVEVIGTRAEHANQLLDRLDAYKSQGRYRQMIAAGKVAMEVHLSGSSDPFIALGGVIKDWNTPQAQQVAASSAVTILFTDMVGSTDMTHSIGDAAAQDIIRAHNHIVRGALLRHRGKEVKHTGDGIMASFDQPSDAVAAAVEIQRKAAEHTAKWPTQALDLRIGMNTGEPIVEENDYFGATVQIAARVCAAAGPGQVWLSEDTYTSLPPTLEGDLHAHGRRQLKGVQGETGLYEVIWDDARRQDLADGAADDTADAPAEVAEAATDAALPSPEATATATAGATAETTAPPPRRARPKPNLDRLPPAPPPRRPAGAPPRKTPKQG